MPHTTLTFSPIPRLSRSDRRGIGLLEGHSELNAGVVFRSFPPGAEQRIRAYMDEWIAGKNGPKSRFHGFDEAGYRECFVFKDRQELIHHRLYGFLCHPQPKSRPRFQLCVLAIHATKREWKTDKAELDRVNQWRNNPGAARAIATVYPDR